MRYKKFIIENYKSISNPIEIDLSKKSLFPIIGVNECGKTTILNAIFAFDWYNDDYDKSIHHLTDVRNLYTIEDTPASITAIIEVNKVDLKVSIEDYINRGTTTKKRKYKYPKSYSNDTFEISITRILDNNLYYTTKNSDLFTMIDDLPDFLGNLISELPYILYFDDFKDSFPDKIEIKGDSRDSNQTWLSIIEQLFIQTNQSYNVYELSTLESRRRKSILGDVSKHLNKSLTKEWANFKLEEREPLQIAVEYFTEEEIFQKENYVANLYGNTELKKEESRVTKHYLKFEVIDKDSEGNDRYFYVRDRSKGFYWFFNFVMKLEFNPKINGSDNNAIYLLDEPGSYLHSFAQGKLCKKLKKLSEKHKVLYCTHSHYLLNPEVIPLNSIYIANKSENSKVELTPYYDHKITNNNFPTAFQTIFDALHLQPLPYELTNRITLLVEGIYDFYAFSMFKTFKEINIIPCKGASSMAQFISLMIGFRINYKALWDNDVEGMTQMQEAKIFFGELEAKKNFHLLPVEKNGRSKILQDLFEGTDLRMIKEGLKLNKNTSFEKTIASLYFNPDKDLIIQKFSKKTIDNFNLVYSHLNEN